MKKILSIIFLILVFGANLLFLSTTTHAETADPGVTTIEGELQIKKPILGINIPQLDFSNAPQNVDEEGYLQLPWIGEYIAAIYKFAMVVASIIAVIVIILSGARMIVSAGGEEKNAAIKRIGQAMVGLTICWGSYAILYNINPALVEFQALKVKYVEPVSIDSMTYNKNPEDSGISPITSNTADLDQLFKAYSACYGYDWRLLKAFAAAESGLRSNSNFDKSTPYKGLFQEYVPYCIAGLNIGKFPSSLNLKCTPTSLFDPELNTAAAAATINYNLTSKSGIQQKCPKASFLETLVLMYVAHNNGPAVMQYVVGNGGCTLETIKEQVISYYTKGAGKKCKSDCVTTEHGLRKYEFALNIVNPYAKQYGVSEIFTSGGKNDSICPAKTGKRVLTAPEIICGAKWSGRKVLALGDSNTEFASSYAYSLTQRCANITFKKEGHSGENADFIYNTIKDRNLRSEGFTDIIVWAGVNNIIGARAGLEKIYNKAKGDGLRVIMITITPWKDYGFWSRTPNAAKITKDTDDWIRSFTGKDGYVVVDVYNNFEDPNNPDALNPTYARDKVHLNAKGQEILAGYVSKQAFSE